MEHQKLFKSGFITQLERQIEDEDALDMYLENSFRHTEDVVLINPTITVEKPVKFQEPDRKYNYDFENATRLYSAYKNMTPTQATDIRIWTYMSHVTFWNYMKNRWPLDEKNSEVKSFILSHWFIERLNAKCISRHGIASLWWGAYLTYDEDRNDPFELTREFFSYLEYKRNLLEGSLGRCRNFTHGFLEFVIENNNSLFKDNKENRIRFLMKRINYLAGYKLFPALSKKEIKGVLETYRGAITQVWGRPT